MKKILLTLGILLSSLNIFASEIKYTDVKGVFKNAEKGLILVDAGKEILWGQESLPSELFELSNTSMSRSGDSSLWTVQFYNKSTDKIDEFSISFNSISGSLNYSGQNVIFTKSEFIETSEVAEAIEKGAIKINKVPKVLGLKYLFTHGRSYVAITGPLYSEKSSSNPFSGSEVWLGEDLTQMKRIKDKEITKSKISENLWQIELSRKTNKHKIKKTVLELVRNTDGSIKAAISVTDTNTRHNTTMLNRVITLVPADPSNFLDVLIPALHLEQRSDLYRTPVEYLNH